MADRDIVLNINLDIDDVKTKSKELQSEIEEIFKRGGSNDEVSVRFKSMLAQLNKLHAKSIDLNGKIRDLENVTFTSDAYKQLEGEIVKLDEKLKAAAKTRDSLFDQKRNLQSTQKPTEEYTKLQEELAQAKTSLDELTAKQQQFIEKGKDSGKQYKNLVWHINNAKIAVQDLEQKSNELETSGLAFTNTQELNQTNEALQDAVDHYDKVYEARQKLIDQKVDLESNGTDYIPGIQTDKYVELIDRLNETNNQATITKERLLALDEVDFNTVENNVSTFEQELQNTADLIRDIPGSAQRVFSAFGSGIASVAKNLAKIAVSSAINYIKSLPKWLAKATVEAGKLAVNLAKIAGGQILNGIKRLSSAIKGVGKNANSSNIDLEKGFKVFIKYAFGVRSFFFLFRKIRSAVIAGFGDLAKVSEPFNVAVSNVLTALKLLRNSFASAFSPIIEVVSPILTHFINQMAEVVNKIGMMIAALTGQKTYMRALPVYQDYAASLDKSSKNADKASKSTKKLKDQSEKLKKTLAGFDDVEILKGPDDNDNDDGDLDNLTDALDGLSEAEQSFEQVPIGELFTDFSDLLKRAWEKADFSEVGRIIGEKLYKALDSIPWEKIKAVLRKIGKSIATLLNGFLEVPGLFNKIGETIAQGLNSAFEFVESFVSNFHWESLGNAIRDLILGVLQNIDWPLIYKTMEELGSGIGTALNKVVTDDTVWSEIFTAIGNKLEAILTAIRSFTMSVDWIDFGQSLGNGLNTGIENFDWNLLADTLIRSINHVFDFWYNFVTTFDFYKFGEHIGSTLSEVLNNIDWVTGSASVAETLNGLLEALNGFLDTTDFGSIGHHIVEIIATFLDTFSWEEFGEFLSNCLQGLLDFFIGIYTSIPWNNLATSICEKIGEFLEGFEWEPTTEKVMEFLGAAFRAVLELNKLPYMILKEVGGKIIDAVKNGIDINLKDIGEWMFEHVVIPLIAGFLGVDKEAAAKAIEMVTGFKTGTEEHWHEVPDYVRDHKDEVLASLSTESAKKEQQAVGKGVTDNLKDGVEKNWKETPDFIKEHQKDLTNPIRNNEAVQDYKDAGQTVPQNIAEGVEENWNQVRDTIDPKASEVVEPFMDGTAQQGYRYAGQMVIAGIIDGMNSESGTLYVSAQNIAIEAYNAMVSALDIGSPSKLFRNGIGKMIPAGMALGILDNEGLVENAMDTLTGTVTNIGKKALEIPAVVKGGVIPYQATINTQTENALNDVVDVLQSNYTDKITSDELQDILATVISQYLNIEFYLGDEQIARHANNGNLRLGRRYNNLALGGTQ